MDFRKHTQHHSDFEEEVAAYLRERGFLLASATYHDVMPPEIADILKWRKSVTARYLRHRADRIAVHPDLPLEFEWEAKTHSSQRYHDMTIDTDQLVEYASKAERMILCLFCYRDAFATPVRDAGFWIHAMPPIREVRLPERWTGQARQRIIEDCNRWLKVNPRAVRNSQYGSNDPFAVIDERELRRLPDWREQIADVIAQAEKCLGPVVAQDDDFFGGAMNDASGASPRMTLVGQASGGAVAVEDPFAD